VNWCFDGRATVLAGLILVTAPFAAVRGDEVAITPGERQLFLDDVGIEKMDGLTRTVNRPTRHPANPVIKPDMPWEDRCQVYGTAMWDPDADIFKIWYLTVPRDRGLRPLDLGDGRVRPPHTTLAAYAFSRDGIHWAKPVLDQFPYDGDRRNNLLDLGRQNCEGISVLYEPGDPKPDRRWKCLYWDHGTGGYELHNGKPYSKDGPDDGLCVAFSQDGLIWKPVPENPVIRKYSDTGQNLLFDPRIKRYVAFGRFGFGRRIARSSSGDCINWTQPELVMECDAADGPKTQYYGAGIDLYEGVYIAMLWVYREGGDGKIDTQLATSRDGVHWARVGNRQTWLTLGDDDGWEGGMVRSIGRIIPRGDQLFIYYCGVHGAHGRLGDPPVVRKHRPAIGLAVARRDGFVSLDAQARPGTLLTRPFVLPAGRLLLNVDAGRGEVTATLCEGDGVPWVGFEKSDPVHTDGVSIPIVFKRADAASLVGKTVRLKLTAKNARLYAYVIEK
jgi:hypothetical protein